MPRPKKVIMESMIKKENATRPENYTSQQGVKATLNLADFEDNQLFAELRRIGYSGELRYSKVINV